MLSGLLSAKRTSQLKRALGAVILSPPIRNVCSVNRLRNQQRRNRADAQ